jgi:hypothetical protein
MATTITKANLDTLFTLIEEHDATKKTASEAIKEAYDLFAIQYGDDSPAALKEAAKDAYKKYKKLRKNRATFIIVEAQTDALTERLLED